MGDYLYALPLIVAVSLVYSGTRYEDLSDILRHAFRTGVWIVLLMLVVFGGLQVFELALAR